MRILITIMILWSSTMAFGQEIWQLSPWAPDSSYVIGAMNSGEPTWVKVDSLGVADSIYLAGDTIRLRDGSGSVILPCEQVYEIFIDKFTGVYTYPSEPVACGAFGYCEDPRTLFYYDGETWNIMVRDARITTSNDYPDKDEVIPLENADIYIDQDTTWFFTWENGWQIFSTKLKTDTLLITQIISDSLANISTEPDSIQRSGNIISLRDGSGSVDISDLVNVADSTIVQNSYGTIITESPTNTYNVKVDSSLFATTYDITQKQNIITGTSGQTLRFDGTNTLIANSLLYNLGNQIGIGTITPTASYILDVSGNTKIRDGFLTVDGTVFINAATTLNMYNSANTGIFHSYQDGATSTDNIVYRGQYKTFTIGYNAGAGQSYANVANKKLHVNGAVSIGEGVPATSVAANSILVQGSATVQDRTGTAATLSAFDTNGKLVGVTLGTGLSWSGNTLNGNVGTVTGNGVATRVAFWNGTNALSSNSNLYWDNVNSRLGVGTTAPSYKIDVVGSDILVNNARIGLGGGAGPLNIAFGNSALDANTSGQFNIAIGQGSLQTNTTGTSNTAIGWSTQNIRSSGGNNISIGSQSMRYANTGNNNTAIGALSLLSVTGSENIAVGASTGSSLTTGNNNTVIGNGAGSSLTTGSNNTLIGYYAGGYNVSGNGNVCIGRFSGYLSTASNILSIDNETVTAPLIGGQFDNNRVGINKTITDISSTLHIGGDVTVDTRTGTPSKMAAFTSAGVLCETTLPTSPLTWGDFTSNIQSWNSTGAFGSGKDVGIGGQPTQDFDVNGNARLRGAIYNSSNSAGTTGQVLTSQGTGSWIWSTPVDQSTTNELQTISTSGTAGNITLSNGGGTLNLNVNDADASTTNELQNLSLSGQSLGISSGTGVTLPIVDVVQGDGIIVNKASGVATVNAVKTYGSMYNTGNLIGQTLDGTYRTIDFSSSFNQNTSGDLTNNRITINTTGIYKIDYSLSYQISDNYSTANTLYFNIYKNGSNLGYEGENRSRQTENSLANMVTIHKSFIASLDVNDYIDLRYKLSTGSSTSVSIFNANIIVEKIN